MSFYVNMFDKAMSGWGSAKNGRSLYVVKCNTLEEAEAIEKAAQDRSEMKYISISHTPRKGRTGDQVTVRTLAQLGGPWLSYMPSTYTIARRKANEIS